MKNLDPHLWAVARAATLQRDSHQCQAVDIYGPVEIPCRETIGVHVHHLNPLGPKYDPGNLLTLCPVHHQRLHRRDPALKDQRKRKARPNAGAYRPWREQAELEEALERRLLELV